jgi:hypothetical protein
MSLGYKDPRWQKKRLERFEAAQWKCQECSSKSKELNLHHYWYEKGNEVWDYPDECFAVLCDRCHVAWHEKKLFIDKQLRFSLLEMDQASGLIAGMQCHINGVDFLFNKDIDALTIVAVVRGFWPPLDYQKLMIDECLLRVSRNESFLLSDVVYRVVPIELNEFSYIADWHRRATGGKRES